MTAVGWYGKLPTLGDFASRRLAPEFIDPWDRWLAAGLEAWRKADDEWLAAFLAAPTWRFLLGPGLPHPASPGYAGVLMPSVDRVGRYFPLTLVRPKWPGAGDDPALVPWLQALEACAVGALQDDWDVDRLDGELERIENLEGDATPLTWPDRGTAAWWCQRSDDGALSPLLVTHGLPGGDAFAALISGRQAFPPTSSEPFNI